MNSKQLPAIFFLFVGLFILFGKDPIWTNQLLASVEITVAFLWWQVFS